MMAGTVATTQHCSSRENGTSELSAAVVFCTAALATLVPVAAHQLGLLRHLPDPRGQMWDSDGITQSKMAHPAGLPDALLGLGSYGATLGLLMASPGSSGARRLVRWKLAADGAAAGFNVIRQVVRFRKLCSWCMGTALATVGMVWFGARALRGLNLTQAP